MERLRVGHDTLEAPVEAVQATDQSAEWPRVTLEGLGPAFARPGQLLSLQRDMLPEVYTGELQRLQDNATVFPGEQARETIGHEPGKSTYVLFTSFDRIPLAVTPIDQVHTAQLIDGTSVMVKMQRPGVGPTIHADIRVMRFLARQLERYAPGNRRFGPGDLVEEFARFISEELDYQVKACSGSLLRGNSQGDKHVFVPRILWEQTSRRVLTMERSLDKKLTHIPSSGWESRRRVTQVLMTSFLRQVFEDGFSHGDPHPDNVFLLENDRFCFHGFGIMGRLSTYDQEVLAQLILAVSSGEVSWIVDTYFEMGVATKGVDREAFTRSVSQALDAYYEAAGKSYSFGEIIRRPVLLGQRHQIKLPRQFLLVSKAFILVRSQTLTLAPDLNALAPSWEYTPHLLSRRLLQGANVQTEFNRRLRTLCMLHHAAALLPDILNRTVEAPSSGKAALHIKHDQL